MRNKHHILLAVAAAVLLGFSPAALTGIAGAETAAPSPSPSADPGHHAAYDIHGHHHGNDGKFHAGGHFILKETSKLLEMECSSLRDSLKAGKTLPELAMEKKGWTEEQYVQKLSESAGKHLDQAVAEGRLTSVEAAKLKEQLPVILKLKIHNMGK
ncbi:hypothetical protein [Paenibacillus sp. sgz500958]|uniref:hypothetical protein n=1 Tax=Paenibacillus sp. sgz500958 TaxID=3242475 RepID=UPI0036D20BBC